MNTESKILIGLAVGVVGAGVLYALWPHGTGVTLAPPYAPPPATPKNWPVTLTTGFPLIMQVNPGDTITISTPEARAGSTRDAITSIEATPPGIIIAPSTPPAGASVVLMTVIATGVTSVAVEWGTSASIIAVQAT